MRVGVKILDDARFRKLLDEQFERHGYALANSDVDEQLYCAHYSHLTPRGSGRAYLLKFTRSPEGDWDTAILLEATTNQELGQSILNLSIPVKSEQKTPENGDRAYFRWVEQILAMCIGEINPD